VRPALVPALLLVVTVLVSGCAFAVTGRALAAAEVTAGVDPGFIQGSDGGEDDRVAAATLADLQQFWGSEFPTISGGRGFTPLKGFFSVDTSRPGPPVPCIRSTTEVEGNAFYCPRADIIAYDRAALLPVLRQQFGDTAAVVVLAHEFGHALQQRLGGSSGGIGASTEIPTILSEGQADCYGGFFLRQVRDGRLPDLRADADGVDSAMAALVTFRDPVGTGASDAAAHGNAFDRVSSFQTGFDGTASSCSGMTVANRRFTQTEFTSLQDQSNQGNLPLPELVSTMSPDLDRFFGGLVRSAGRPWTPPVPAARDAPACAAGVDQGSVALCVAGGGPPSLRIDAAALGRQHDTIGDYASGTVLASRYGLAALGELGQPTTGADAGRRALCLAGAYTGSVADATSGGFGLSPGDLDEAVQLLLRSDRPASDAAGNPGAGTGYERIRVFRDGVTAGPQRCLSS
jgi:predicted metalloprotease